MMNDDADRDGQDATFRALMLAAQDGDRDAYARLLTALLPCLRRVILEARPNLQDIEHIVQDVLLSLHAARQTYDPERPFLPWLTAIIRIRLADAARSYKGPVANEAANETRRRIEGVIFLVLFGLTIPLANWLASSVGTTCVPNGPCLIWVAPGLMSASGVLMIGLALVLRDLVQRRLGVGLAAGAVLAGAVISAFLAPPALVIASAVAFLVSEFADLAVYTSLARRRFVAAVLASSLVGLVVDSILFLWLAFGSLEFLAGQIVGKTLMIVVSMPFVMLLGRRDERVGLAPA